MDNLTIELPPVNMGLSPNRKNGKHWSSTQKDKEADRDIGFSCAKNAAKGKQLQANTGYALSIIFYRSDKRHVDLDNLLSASKHRIDGIAKALGIDDSQFKPVTIDCQYRKEAGMMVLINKKGFMTNKSIDLTDITGERKFITLGKFVVGNNRLFAGILTGIEEPPISDNFELWECEITIKPIKKSEFKKEFKGY